PCRSGCGVLLLPLDLGIAGGGVAGIVVVEQFPAALLRLPGRLCRGSERRAAGDRGAQIPAQAIKIGALVGERLRPVGGNRAVPRNDPSGGETRQFLGDPLPAGQAAVYDRDMAQEQEIASKQGAAVLV